MEIWVDNEREGNIIPTKVLFMIMKRYLDLKGGIYFKLLITSLSIAILGCNNVPEKLSPEVEHM